MNATLLELRDRLIIDTGVGEDPQFPTGRLNRLINLAQRYVQVQLNNLGMKKWEVREDITNGLSSATFGGIDVRTVDIGDAYFKNMLEGPDSIIFLECSNSLGDPSDSGLAYATSIIKFHDQISNTYLSPTARKPVFTRLANKVWIAPEEITTVKAYYYRAITDLTEDSSTTEIPLEFEGFLLKKAELEVEQIFFREVKEKELKRFQLEKGISLAYQDYMEKSC